MDENVSKANPWMVSTLVLVGFIVGFGAGKLPFGNWLGLEKASVADGKDSIPPEPPKPRGLTEEQIAALPDDDTVIGNPDAKITVVEFSDFQCPFCAASFGVANSTADKLISRDPSWKPAVPLILKYAREGKVKFVYRDFPLEFHAQAQETAEAAECADEQGKFLEMHDKIFAGSDEWIGDDDTAKKVLTGYAKDIGLDTDQFKSCFESGKYKDEVRKDFLDGATIGVSGTPAFYVNGVELSGAQSAGVFESLFESLLKE